ncbi:MAG: type I glutamate--ammonia ligase [Chloroflexota bacterium]
MAPPSRDDKRQAEEVVARARQDGIKYINLQFVDIVGIVKSVTIPTRELADCVAFGKWFDGSSIEGFARIAESDMYLQPDLRTYAPLPWEQARHTARIICSVYTPQGEPFPGDPRFVLRRALTDVEALGFSFQVGPEFEFFVFKADGGGTTPQVTLDQGGYFDLATDTSAGLRMDVVSALEELGIAVESDHHETAAGQHELDLKYDEALKAADNAVTLKYAVKAIAQRQGLYASFMPKPMFGVAGSGMHIHQSFFTLGSQENAFHAPSDPYGLSDLARHFIAGQLYHARGMCAIVSPLINSYKRLVPGYEAPVYISWARINRSALIRIPKASPGNPLGTRVELRCPDPSCNPYLAFAVMLKCGLDGIKRELPLPAPIEENLFQFDVKRLQQREVQLLPSSLGEALEEMKRDSVVQEALGEHAYQRFLEVKQLEVEDYRKQVTPWEMTHYFPVF